MHRQVDGSDDLPRPGADRRSDRPKPVRKLLVVHGDAHGPNPLHLGAKSRTLRDRVRTSGDEVGLAEDLLEPVLGDEREQRLPIAVQ